MVPAVALLAADRRAGCTSWDLYNRMLIPTLYDDDEQEYFQHLVEHVGLWDVAVERPGRDRRTRRREEFTQFLRAGTYRAATFCSASTLR